MTVENLLPGEKVYVMRRDCAEHGTQLEVISASATRCKLSNGQTYSTSEVERPYVSASPVDASAATNDAIRQRLQDKKRAQRLLEPLANFVPAFTPAGVRTGRFSATNPPSEEMPVSPHRLSENIARRAAVREKLAALKVGHCTNVFGLLAWRVGKTKYIVGEVLQADGEQMELEQAHAVICRILETAK